MPPSATGVRCSLRHVQEPTRSGRRLSVPRPDSGHNGGNRSACAPSRMLAADVSDALWTARYVSVEAGGVVIGDDDHRDMVWRTCDMRRISPGELGHAARRPGHAEGREDLAYLRPPTKVSRAESSRAESAIGSYSGTG